MAEKNTIPDGLPLDDAMETFRKEATVNKKDQAQKEKIRLSLAAPIPKQSSIDINSPKTFGSGVLMTLNTTEIIHFEGNPRKYHDPEQYNQIKESIRASGVQQPVHVTKRPGAQKYVLAKGGNTRLQILNELYQETGDLRFTLIPCIYVAYVSDFAILLDHIIENEMRADPCFFDKAAGYAELRDTLNKEQNRTLSLRDLCDCFKSIKLGNNEKRTLEISHGLLAMMMFAHDKLSALERLTPYLSKQKTIEIRKLYHDLFGIEQIKKNGDAYFDNCFSEALGQWRDLHATENDIDMASLLTHIKSSVMLRYQLDLSLLPQNDRQPPVAQETGSVPEDDQPASVQTTAIVSDNRPNKLPGASMADDRFETENNMVEEDNYIDAENVPITSSFQLSKTEALDSIHQHVLSLLNIIDFPELFVKNPAFKYGFYIEMPDDEQNEELRRLVYQEGHLLHPEATGIFWFLLEFSEQTVNWGEASAPVYTLSHDSPFYQFTTDSDKAVNAFFGSEAPCGFKAMLPWLCSSRHTDIRALLFGLFNATALFESLG